MGLFGELIEFLVPLVIFLAFTVGPRLLEQLGKSGEGDERPSTPVSEEQRRIQEEIRRKILENQRQQQPQQPNQAEQAPPAMRRNYDPTRSESAQPTPSRPEPAAYTPPVAQEDQFAELAKAREEAERTQRQIEAAQRKARSIMGQQHKQTVSKRRPVTPYPSASSIRAATRNPARLREAIVLNEVIGRPIALRDQNN